MSMAYHFDRDDVALPGFHKYMKKASDEERENVKKPERDEWGTGLEAMQTALDLEKHVNQALLDLHKIAENHGDSQMTDFIEGEFLKEQVEGIEQVANYCTMLKRCGAGLGEFQFDKLTLSG